MDYIIKRDIVKHIKLLIFDINDVIVVEIIRKYGINMTLLTLSQKSFETLLQTKTNTKLSDGSLIHGESRSLYENMFEPCTNYYVYSDTKVVATYYHNLKGGVILV